MAVYQSGAYRVKASGIEKVKDAIREFVAYIDANEPGTEMYLAWQEKEDPTRFIHLFRFRDSHAQATHGKSHAVKKFEAAYKPELTGGGVTFTDYELVAGKMPHETPAARRARHTG